METLGVSVDDQNSDDVQDTKKTMFQRVNHGLFGILYLMAKEVHTTQSSLYLLTFLNTCQVLYFSFAQNIHFPWHSSLDPVVQVIHYLNFGFFVHHNLDSETVLAIYLVVTLLVVANIFLASYVGVSFAKGNVKSLWMLSVLRSLARLTTTVLFMPLTTMLLLIFSCTQGVNTVLNSRCGSIEHIAAGFLTGVVLILFVSFTALTVLVFVDRNPVSQDCVAQPNGRVNCFIFLINLGLDVIYVNYDPPVDEYSSELYPAQLSLAAVVFLATFATTASYIYFLPFYHLGTNRVYICGASSTLWTAICLIVCILVGDSSDPGPVLLLIGGLPLFVFFTNHMVDWRVQSLLNTPLSSIGSPALAEVKLRLEYQSGTGGLTSNANDSNTETIQPFDVLAYTQRWRETINIFPRSAFLHFQVSNIYYSIAKDELMGARFFRKASKLDKSVDQYFIVFQQQRVVEENQAGGLKSMDALSYIAFEHHFQEAKRKITDAQRLQVSFWKLLLNNRKTINKSNDLHHYSSHQSLFDLGGKVHSATSFARYHLNRLVRVSGASPRALRLYATFLNDVLNDSYLANEFLMKADQVEDGLKNDTSDVVDDDANFNAKRKNATTESANLFNDALATVTISGEEENLGEILTATTSATSLYGYRKSELIGQNISVLCPQPFSIIHDSFLKRYFETGNPHILNCTRMVFGLHYEGYIFPVNLHVTPLTASDGQLMFVGQFTTILSNNDFVLMNNAGKVYSCTKALFDRLGINKTLLRDERVNVTSFLPESILEAEFDTDDLLLSFNVTNDDEEYYSVTKTPVRLKSDALGEPYDISMTLLRLKKMSSQYSVASSHLSTSMQPLGFMKGNDQAAIAHSSVQSYLPALHSTSVIPEEGEIDAKTSSARRISIRRQSSELSANPVSNGKNNSLSEIITKKSLPKVRIPRAQNNSGQSGCGFANLMDSPTNNETAHKICPFDGTTEKSIAGDYETKSCPMKQSSTISKSSEVYHTQELLPHKQEELVDEQSEDVLAPLRSSLTNRQSMVSPTRQNSSLADGASESGTSVGLSVGNRKERIHQFHRIIESRNNHPDPHIQRLQKIFVVMILSFSMIAIIVCIMSLRSLAAFSNSHKVLQLSFERSRLIHELVGKVHTIQVTAQLPPSKQTIWSNLVNNTRTEILDQAAKLQQIHELIAAEENGALHFSQQAPHGLEMWSQLSVSSDQDHFENANLYVAVWDLVSNLRKMVKDTEECSTSCMFVLFNGPNVITNATNMFSEAWFSSMHDTLIGNAELNFWSMILVTLYLSVAIAKGFFPVVTRISSSKDSVASAFEVIPMFTVQMILDSCKERLKQNQSNGTDKNVEGGDLGNDETDPRLSIRKDKTRSTLPRQLSNTFVSRQSEKHSVCSKLTHCFSSMKVLIRLCVMFVTVLAYFASIWQWDFAVRDTVEEYTFNTFLAGKRLVSTTSVSYWSQLPLPQLRDDAASSKQQTFELIDAIHEIDHALVVGRSSESSTFQGSKRPAKKGVTWAEQLDLLFHQGCQAETCHTASRSLKEGLHVGLAWYLSELESEMRGTVQDYLLYNYFQLTGNETSVLEPTELSLLRSFNPENTALRLSLVRSLDLYVQEGEGYIASVVTVRVVVVILFVVGLSLLYWFVHRTFIRQMDMELKHTRAMLLMVPGDVFEKVPEMKKFIRNMQNGSA